MADNTPPSSSSSSPAPENRYYQEIEEFADLYEPAIYDLLTFQRRSWQTAADPESPNFIPLSTVKLRSPRDAKMFVVGLIPPSAFVTGRLLDRSATVAAIQGFAQDVDVGEGGGGGATGPVSGSLGGVVTVPGYQIPPSTAGFQKTKAGLVEGEKGEPGEPAKLTKHSVPEMWNRFHDAYVKLFGREPTNTELLFAVSQAQLETSPGWPNNNPGNIASTKSDPTAYATPQKDGSFRYWKTYPTAQAGAEAYIGRVFNNPNVIKAAQSGDLMGYLTSLSQTGYFEEPIKTYYRPYGSQLLKQCGAAVTGAGGPAFGDLTVPKDSPLGCPFTESGQAYQARSKGQKVDGKPAAIFRFRKDSFYNDGCSLGLPADPNDPNGKPTSFAGTGSEAKAKAEKGTEKAANKDLNENALGQALLAAQAAYITALQISLEQMRRTPPLRMLVNPTSFKPSEEKIISDGNFSRGDGPVIEHWGEQQMKISANGRLAGFYSLDVSGKDQTKGAAGSSPGLGRIARNFSESYQNFLSLYLIYRNNGNIFLENFTDSKQPKSNNLALVGSVYIYYDDVLYIGSFDSFNVTESDDKPFSLEYDYSFTVRARFELDRIPDPLENYGNSTLFAQVLPEVASKSIPVSSEKPPEPTSAEDIAKFQALLARDAANKPKGFDGGLPTEGSIGLSPPPTEGGDFKLTTFGQPAKKK